MKLSSRKFALPLLMAFFALIQVSQFACSGKPIEEQDPGSIYKAAEEDINTDHYLLAIDKLRLIKNKYPYSKYALDAQLRLADVYFLQESYSEAALAYETFRDLHPKHEKVAYAMFRLGLSYYKDIPDPIARDLTPAQKAIDAFNDFLHRFPMDPNAKEAAADLTDSRKKLADKELQIGNFYYKRNFYDSAKGRYQKLIDLYPETDAAKEAQTKLTKIEQGNLHNQE
jgi:outer membrane protein assembly factor BamD